MGIETHPSTKITWRISGFSGLTERKYYSDMFPVGGTYWRILLYPKGDVTDHLSIYLGVAESNILASGWEREAQFSLTMVNQHDDNLSLTEGGVKTFTSRDSDWGFAEFISLSELSRGFLVDDTLAVEAELEVRRIHPPIISTGTLRVEAAGASASVDRFDTYFASLEGSILNTCFVRREQSVAEENVTNSETPSLKEVERAKQSLHECLTDLFKLECAKQSLNECQLDMKERLAKALSTLSLSKDGLSPDQRKMVVLFWENFDEFTSDFLTFEQENSEYELQKLLKDQIIRAVEKNYRTHLSLKRSHSELSKEKEELKKRQEDIESKITKLMADWDSLLAESKKLESNYKSRERKVADAEEKKRIAEERISRSTTAWANLKKRFGRKEL